MEVEGQTQTFDKCVSGVKERFADAKQIVVLCLNVSPLLLGGVKIYTL